MPSWPPLPYDAWKPTLATLHRFAQIVGKVKLAMTPRSNHFWNVAFSVTPHGLGSGPIECAPGTIAFELDLLRHALVVRSSAHGDRLLPFAGRAVADFYRDVFARQCQLRRRILRGQYRS